MVGSSPCLLDAKQFALFRKQDQFEVSNLVGMYLLGHSESANNLLDEQLGNCAGRYWESFHPFGEVVCNDDYVFISGLREGKWSQYIKSNALHGESNNVFPH